MDTTAATSSLTWLTGPADGDPVELPCAVAEVLADVVQELDDLAARCGLAGPAVDLAEVLTGRAGLLGTHRQGQRSVGGSCRLLPAGPGSAGRASAGPGSSGGEWLAVNLARESDRASVGALLGRTIAPDIDAETAWELLTDHLAGPLTLSMGAQQTGPDGGTGGTASQLLAQARLLGMPVALLPEVAPWSSPAGPPHRIRPVGERASARRRSAPLVVDLSAMWAGPLCTRLLTRAGCRVIKVESEHRLDGARGGPPAFFDWLHAGQESVVLDFGRPSGHLALRRLIDAADVVVEASRPRALAQLGIDSTAVLARRPGVTWLRITGYGDEAPDAVAFGDDAAVAAGLVARDREGAPVFVGDAIADPITGLMAAHGVLTALAAGGGALVEVTMVEATRFAASRPWPVRLGEGPAGRSAVEPAPPAPVRVTGSAPAPGADTAAVLAELATPAGADGADGADGDADHGRPDSVPC